MKRKEDHLSRGAEPFEDPDGDGGGDHAFNQKEQENCDAAAKAAVDLTIQEKKKGTANEPVGKSTFSLKELQGKGAWNCERRGIPVALFFNHVAFWCSAFCS
jgi:hypothetical protein